MSSARFTTFAAVLFLIFCQLAIPSHAQYGITFDIKKPKEFENRVLRSEKSNKKFSAPRRFIQNTITHYNYFYNANNKLNETLERAKLSFKDDYSQLIPFYNYSLDVTAADSIQLDSISYKAQAAIVLHDLRGDWADNMYLLWGASYYLQKQFDSAYLMFQFINYAFAPKEKDGYYLAIGSARDGNSATSISTKEKNSLTKRMFSEPPSRNDAFIWQIRNHLMQDHYSEASSLILALKNDTLFPARLKNDLEEVQAFSFYRQQMWDSSAAHLEAALSNATTKQERARWEFLLGQLHERTKNFELSAKFYDDAVSHTTDPIMDIYGRLGSVRVNKTDGDKAIENNIATLTKMARRDKYQEYRDIIYYMAAQMELERNNVDGALELLLLSTKYTANNPSQRNKAFLQLAELSFNKKLYRPSYNFYDSIQLGDLELKDPEAITARKNLLGSLVTNIEVISRQDSLQRLAALPEDDRKDIVKKTVRRLRKLQGLKDEGVATTTGSTIVAGQQQTAPPLFSESKKGEWYFYSSNSRQKGLADFKSRWGTRPNTDNWRRSASQSATIRPQNDLQSQLQMQREKLALQAEDAVVTYDALYKRIPLTEPQMKVSNDSIANAMFALGLIYIQQLEDCTAGTETFEDLRTRFPKHPGMDQVLFNLYYCYNKNSDGRAATIKNELTKQFPQSNYSTIVSTGKNPQDKGPNTEITRKYEKIYDLFIEGNFNEAVTQKKVADSLYGNSYWTPQLLYIEAVYYIKLREDSTAKGILTNIISQFAGKPLAARAETLLDVLNRRAQIEEELRNLVIERPANDTTTRYRGGEPIAIKPQLDTGVTKPVITPPKDTVVTKPVVTPPKDTVVTKPVVTPPKDTVVAKPVVTPPKIDVPKPKPDSTITKVVPPPTKAYGYAADAPHMVVIVLNKVDPIFVNEAKNAFFRYNRDAFYNKQMTADLLEIDADNRLLLINPFKNAAEAVAYVDQTRPKTATEIVPWLKGGKYTYLIITEKNLEMLKETKDIEKYRQFLDKNIPGKF